MTTLFSYATSVSRRNGHHCHHLFLSPFISTPHRGPAKQIPSLPLSDARVAADLASVPLLKRAVEAAETG